VIVLITASLILVIPDHYVNIDEVLAYKKKETERRKMVPELGGTGHYKQFVQKSTPNV
jgi:hypothetical protein